MLSFLCKNGWKLFYLILLNWEIPLLKTLVSMLCWQVMGFISNSGNIYLYSYMAETHSMVIFDFHYEIECTHLSYVGSHMIPWLEFDWKFHTCSFADGKSWSFAVMHMSCERHYFAFCVGRGVSARYGYVGYASIWMQIPSNLDRCNPAPHIFLLGHSNAPRNILFP